MLLVFRRPYGVCPQCHHGEFPLDRELGLLPGPFTPSVQAHIAHLGTWLPFARAATVFTTFTQIPVSESTVQRLTEAVGVAALTLAEAEVAHIQAVWPSVPPGPTTMVISVDGAMVPLVDGDWAEVKTLAVGAIPAPAADSPTNPRITDLSYCSRLLDAQDFQQATLGELHRRGMERAEQIVAVNDGAPWIQNWLAFHCPTAVRILDFAHAAHRLALIGQAEGPTATPATRAWFTTIQHRLKHLGMAALVPEIEQLAAQNPDAPSCREHLAYLTKRLDQMEYPAFQAAGWPIGSGIVESANKLVVEARLKGAGMHWARPSVNPMLVLRNAVCNNRWAEVWAASGARIRQQGRVGRAITPKNPPAPPPPPEPPPPPGTRWRVTAAGEGASVAALWGNALIGRKTLTATRIQSCGEQARYIGAIVLVRLCMVESSLDKAKFYRLYSAIDTYVLPVSVLRQFCHRTRTRTALLYIDCGNAQRSQAQSRRQLRTGKAQR